ncbi:MULTISPECIES: hypothetical protein [unclassified Rickettsia]|uniref:hypothetical protein n=1 Tax=unclassified Rickettsia TaxID=114295 RepID=UPI00313305D2
MSTENLNKVLKDIQNEILNSGTTQDKLTTIETLQKSIHQKELKNEKLTQEEIDNIYKTLNIFEEVKEHNRKENIRNPRILNKNYYKLTDPRDEERTYPSNHKNLSSDIVFDNELEWDDSGMPAAFQKSYGSGNVLDRLKTAVDDYIFELKQTGAVQDKVKLFEEKANAIQSSKDKRNIPTASTSVKDRIQNFEGNNPSKIKKYWTEGRREFVEKHAQHTQSKDPQTERNQRKNAVSAPSNEHDNYAASRQETHKQLINKFENLAKTKEIDSKEQSKRISSNNSQKLQQGNTKNLKEKFEKLANEAKLIGTQAQQKSKLTNKSNEKPKVKPANHTRGI